MTFHLLELIHVLLDSDIVGKDIAIIFLLLSLMLFYAYLLQAFKMVFLLDLSLYH